MENRSEESILLDWVKSSGGLVKHNRKQFLNVSKEWCKERCELEGDLDITAGIPDENDGYIVSLYIKGKRNTSLYNKFELVVEDALYSFLRNKYALEVLQAYKNIKGQGINDINLLISFLNFNSICNRSKEIVK